MLKHDLAQKICQLQFAVAAAVYMQLRMPDSKIRQTYVCKRDWHGSKAYVCMSNTTI